MSPVSEAELLWLWDQGQKRHPIDRALLLCSWARPDLDPDSLAGLPLGVINGALLQLRAALFGNRWELRVTCGHCQEVLEIPLHVSELLRLTDKRQGDGEPIHYNDFSFRSVTCGDLALVVHERDGERAALRLLEACCLSRPEGEEVCLSLLDEVDHLLENSDPLADPQLTAQCPACSEEVQASLDPGAQLWTELTAYARDLLAQVHVLASAYGWTEDEILALAPGRREIYLTLAGGG